MGFGSNARLRLHGAGKVIFRPPLRRIAQFMRARIAPPCAGVVGHAVEDLVDEAFAFEPDLHELEQVVWPDPDREPPGVDRQVVDIADADAGHADAVLVGIHRA